MSTRVPKTLRLTSAEQQQADDLLRHAPFAFVAMADGAGPYVVPMNFAYEAGAGDTPGRLLLHSGPGRKSTALAADPRVCIAITTEAAFDQGPTPCKDGFSFRSVLVEGRAALLDDPDERKKALRAIVGKYDPAAADAPLDPRALAKTLVYAIRIDKLTYKRRPRR